jgi:long-chain acyl-CoA synthetase
VKDLFKTDKGKYVSPVPIETKLGKNGFIESLCLIGAGQKQPVMVCTTSEAAQDVSDEELLASIEASVVELNKDLENHEFIAKTIVSRTQWTIDDGHFTPTMKVRRHFIEELYNEQIPTWYKEEADVILI